MRRPAVASTSAGRLFSWAGALVFAVSLAHFLVAYLTSFGVPDPDGDPAAAAAWNVALFTGFALHHSIFARTRLRAWVERTLPGLERSCYVWIASLLFLAVCAWWRPLPGVAWAPEGAALWGLRLLQASGLGLVLRSAAILDVWELAGVRSRPAAGGIQATDVEFKTVGPYGWVRHPIYAGWFLLVWGASPMTMTRLVFAAVSCVYLLVAIPLEERTMRAGAPEAYDRYAQQVRWKLVPGVY